MHVLSYLLVLVFVGFGCSLYRGQLAITISLELIDWLNKTKRNENEQHERDNEKIMNI